MAALGYLAIHKPTYKKHSQHMNMLTYSPKQLMVTHYNNVKKVMVITWPIEKMMSNNTCLIHCCLFYHYHH